MKKLLLLLAMTSLSNAQDSKLKDYWFNGAEISTFKLEQAQYGTTYSGRAELIFATEPFLLGKHVKNERGQGESTTVLKLNSLRSFNTGIYSNRTMISTFRPMDLEKFPHALKSTSSLQDWCGQSFQQMNYRNDSWKVEHRSYFEHGGDQNLTLAKSYAEDGLWLTLRLNPQKLPTGDIQVIPGAFYIHLRGQKIAPIKAQASLKQDGESSTYTLTYPEIRRTLTIQFSTKFPHFVQKWTDKNRAGTTTATLDKRLTHMPYWNHNRPQDGDKRKQLGLDPVAN